MIVVVYVMDSLRPDFLSCYGYSKPTSPYIDSFAKDAVLFKNAYSTASWTKPAAASLLTGQYPRAIHMNHSTNRMPSKATTLPEILSREGFKCIGISANCYVSAQFDFGRGFHNYVDLYLKGELEQKRRINTLDHLSSEKREQLFGRSSVIIPQSEDLNEELFGMNIGPATFVLLWSIDTHEPYFVRGAHSYFGNDVNICIPTWELKKYASKRKLLLLQSLYEDMIRYNDVHFGHLLDWLRRRNFYDDALVILLSDHGQGFMEHGFNSHGGLVFEEQVRIPLLVKLPQNKYAGNTVGEPVQITDIMPTILHLLGIKHTGPMDGQSLLEVIDGSPKSQTIFCETQMESKSTWSTSVRMGRWKWLRVTPAQKPRFNLTPRGVKRWVYGTLSALRWRWRGAQLYDLEEDPMERHPVRVGTSNEIPDFPRILNDLLRELDKRARLLRQEGMSEEALNKKLVEHLRNLGYLD